MPDGSRVARDEEAVRRFIERFALNLAEAGRPRMPARVFATVLGVSPAAVSGAVRYLTQLRLVSREREPGERVDHYRVSSDTWYEAITRRDEMVGRWLQDLAEGVKSVGPDTAAGARLEETRAFFEYLLQEVPRLLERWRAQRQPDPAQ